MSLSSWTLRSFERSTLVTDSEYVDSAKTQFLLEKMFQQSPASMNSLPEEVLEKILLQLRTPKRPQFWLLRGVNQRWLSLVRRHSNFRAEIQSYNLRMLGRDSDTAYLFHLVESSLGWKTESEFLPSSCIDNSTFFGHINDCKVQINRRSALDLADAVVNGVGVLSERLCLTEADIPLSLEVALSRCQLGLSSQELPAMEPKLTIHGLSFCLVFRKQYTSPGPESATVTQAVRFFEWLASEGALQSLTSLSLLALCKIDDQNPFDLAPQAILASRHLLAPIQRERFCNMLPESFRSETLKTLSTFVHSLGDIRQLANRFPRLEQLTLYGRFLFMHSCDWSGLLDFASLKRLSLYVSYWIYHSSPGCCAGMVLPSVTLPSVSSLTVCAPDTCSQDVAKLIGMAPAVSDLTLTGMSCSTVSASLKAVLSKQPLPQLKRLELSLDRVVSNEVEDLVRGLAASQDRLPALQDLKIAAESWTGHLSKQNFELLEAFPANIKSVELDNVFGPIMQKLATAKGCYAMEWLRYLIDQLLHTPLDSAVISVRRSVALLKRHFAQFRDRFSDRPDQFGAAEFQNGWRYLGEAAKWEVTRDLGEPNALASLLEFDEKKRLLKFRLMPSDNDTNVKWLDLYIAPKATLPA